MKKRAELNNLDLGPLQAFQERKSLGEHVFESLKQAIVRGKISSGEWLVESHIAEMLGISRTPVREAFHKLEREQLIERQPRGGFTVLGLNREDIEETFGIRSVLEGYAANLAAIKHEAQELDLLEQKIEEFQKALDRKNMNLLPAINTEFHDLLYGLSKSPKLINMINGLKDQIYRYREMILKESKYASASNLDHKKMLKTIRNRDAAGAEQLVREHILRGQAMVLQAYDRQRLD
ncbi:MAG: GntR family transcriptional regulator [Deltaproteobacteria bacterium]|nr:GntR family transcriptional regulator [Deltaproteobacteria bacterium]